MKHLILLIALAGLTFTAAAQDSQSKVLFGLKAGFNISNIYDQEGGDFEADAKIGVLAGAFLNIPLGESIGLQPEVLFSQKGFRGTADFLGSSYEFTRTTSYLDLPLLLAIKTGSKATIVVGPHLSYLLAQRDVLKSNDYSSAHDQTFDNDNIRRNTVGLTGGADFNLDPVILSARAGWDFVDNKGDGSSSTPRYKNAWLQFSVGFIL